MEERCKIVFMNENGKSMVEVEETIDLTKLDLPVLFGRMSIYKCAAGFIYRKGSEQPFMGIFS